MTKPITNGIYLDRNQNIYKITSYNKELANIDSTCSSITIKYLGKDPYFHEYFISLNVFLDIGCKYLGQNEEVAQVLYGNKV